MTSIQDIPYEDILKFLDTNDEDFTNKDDAYNRALKLLKNKNTKGHTTRIIEWMMAHNLLINNVDVPNYTVYQIDNMNQREINDLAKLLGMSGNNKENIKNILRYLNKLNYVDLFTETNKPNYKNLTEKEIDVLFRSRFENKGKNAYIENETLAKYYELKYIDLSKILKNIEAKTDLSIDVIKLLNEIANKIYKDLMSDDAYSFIQKLNNYPEYLSERCKKLVEPEDKIENKVIIIINDIIKDILQLSFYYVLDHNLKYLGYRDLNYVISQDYELRELLKDLIIPYYYFYTLQDIAFEFNLELLNSDILRKYPILIPTAFNKYLDYHNINLDKHKKDFLMKFLYYNYLNNNIKIDMQDYLDQLLTLINDKMSYKEFTSSLIKSNNYLKLS
jgi:hypothetical protein